MTSKGAALAAIAIVFALAVPAGAQAKDPFRPPPGAGALDQPAANPGATTGGATGGAPVPQQPDRGLPRTGLDYSVPILLALVLVAAGASLRLVVSALAP